MSHLFSDDLRRNPYAEYARLRSESPVCKDPGTGLWMVFDYAGVKRILTDCSANHDPAQFADSERFEITRDPNPHLAFGLGNHFCPGAPLARLEARIALGQLLTRLKNLKRADTAPWEPRKGLHVHGPARLPIRFEPGARTG